jgi:hypothetical protein
MAMARNCSKEVEIMAMARNWSKGSAQTAGEVDDVPDADFLRSVYAWAYYSADLPHVIYIYIYIYIYISFDRLGGEQPETIPKV